MSGFTRLSESFSSLGAEGCEDFSLVMSRFLARMCKIIHEHGGDIDCFAGDALLVAFSHKSQHPPSVTGSSEHDGEIGRKLSDESGSESLLPNEMSRSLRSSRTSSLKEKVNDIFPSSLSLLGSLRTASRSPQVRPGMSFWEDSGIEISDAVMSAVACATAICRELNGFRASENHPPLGIHAALSAGTVYAVECGKDLPDMLAAFPFIACMMVPSFLGNDWAYFCDTACSSDKVRKNLRTLSTLLMV